MSSTVHGAGGTVLSTVPTLPGEFRLYLRRTAPERVTSARLTIKNSQQLRALLEEAEIQAAPKPSKADRIREQANPWLYQEATGRDAWDFRSGRLDDILAILDEEGDL